MRAWCQDHALRCPRRALDLKLIGWGKSMNHFPFLPSLVKAADCKTMLFWIAHETHEAENDRLGEDCDLIRACCYGMAKFLSLIHI
eukprot:9839546-Alexandrium_andersonii.AAC.1